MADQITNYQCPACTGPLKYDGESGKLVCPYCGSSYTVEEIERLYAEKDEKAAEAKQKADAAETDQREKATEAEQQVPEEKAEQEAYAAREQQDRQSAGTGQKNTAEDAGEDSGTWSNAGSQEWKENPGNLRTYTCPSCGAELICDENTAATQCPYCGNPSIVPGQFTGALKPDYVVPFKLEKKDALEALKQHYKGKFLLPKRFKSENQVQKIQGIYVPFWLFDGSASGNAVYEATRSSTYRQGDYQVTETRHYTVRRSGNLAFQKIPADASKRMPDDIMDSVEPFDYREMKDFSTAYLPGYLADKYDVSAEECGKRADKRAENSLYEELRSTVHGYDTVTQTGGNCNLQRGKVYYALMPVWILNTKWKDKNFIFAMNGQTGRMVGNLPISWGKFWGTFAVLAGGLSALFYWISTML